ncbi:MAG: twin transmembrane helix small protein [Gammaproteobacteria bacterium]|nr:twin transmembrane helix small protein [Gammaproteobacteria bacterium]
MKLLIILVFLGILVALGSAFFALTKGTGKTSKSTVKALSWRIGLSIALFLFLLFAAKMGWIQPTESLPQ